MAVEELSRDWLSWNRGRTFQKGKSHGQWRLQTECKDTLGKTCGYRLVTGSAASEQLRNGVAGPGFLDDQMRLHQQLVPLDNTRYGLHPEELCMWQWGCTFSTIVAEPTDVSFERWGCCVYACLGDGRGENIGWRERALFQLQLMPLMSVIVELQPG